MSRMLERLERGELALGTFALTSGPELVETMGSAGLDAVCIDHMVTAIDWGLTANMIRAARAFDMTPWVRLQSYPWQGGGVDGRMTADVLRAIAAGAEGVTVSVHTPAEVEAILQPQGDQHRRVWARGSEFLISGEPDVLVFPMIESLGGAREFDQIVSVEGLQGIFLGMGDLSRELGHARDNEHPEVLDFVRSAAERTHERDQILIANTPYVRDPGDIARAVEVLRNVGVDAVWIPYPSSIVRATYLEACSQIRSAEA